MNTQWKFPTVATPWSADPADYPGCACWFQFMQTPIANGTVLVDRMGNVLDTTVVQNGAGDADATYSSFTTSGVVSNEVYARTIALPDIINVDQSLIIEIDMVAAESVIDGAAHIEFGDPFNGAAKGFSVQHTNTTGSLALVARNAANNGTVSSTLGSAPNNNGQRRHICLVWDRETADPGILSYYVNGVLQFTGALSGAVGSNFVPSSGALRIGQRLAGNRITSAQYYNLRMWALAEIPANIAAAVVQMAENVNEFPPLLRGAV